MKRKVLQLNSGFITKKVQEVPEGVKDGKEKEEIALTVANSLEIGFAVSIPLVLAAIGGSYLDNRLKTSPVATLLLLFFGVVLAALRIKRIIESLR